MNSFFHTGRMSSWKVLANLVSLSRSSLAMLLFPKLEKNKIGNSDYRKSWTLKQMQLTMSNKNTSTINSWNGFIVSKNSAIYRKNWVQRIYSTAIEEKRMGENILQVIVDYEKVYGMTSVVDGVGIWINNGIWVVEVLPWKKREGNLSLMSKDSGMQI